MTPDQIAAAITVEDAGRRNLDINPTIEAVCAAYVHDDPTSLRWVFFRQLRQAISDVLLNTRGILTYGRETYGDGYVLDCEILVTSTGAHKEHWYTLMWDYTDTLQITVRNAGEQRLIPLRLVEINQNEFSKLTPQVAKIIAGFLAKELPGSAPPLVEVIAEEITPVTGVTHLIESVEKIPDMAYYAVKTKTNLLVYCTGDMRQFDAALGGDILALNGHLGKVIPKHDAH